MSHILIEYSNLYEEVTKLKDICSRISEKLQDLHEKIKGLDIFWDGDANAYFLTSINKDLAFMSALQISVKECVELLEDVIRAYQETEKVVDKIIDDIRLQRV